MISGPVGSLPSEGQVLADAVVAWYDEIASYDYAQPGTVSSSAQHISERPDGGVHCWETSVRMSIINLRKMPKRGPMRTVTLPARSTSAASSVSRGALCPALYPSRPDRS